MKLKNVKIGTRVQFKENWFSLKKGMTGTIIGIDDDIPYISWDNYTIGHNGLKCEQTRIDLGLPEYSVYGVFVEHLKRID